MYWVPSHTGAMGMALVATSPIREFWDTFIRATAAKKLVGGGVTMDSESVGARCSGCSRRSP